MASQSVADLRTLVARRAGVGRRVVVLASDGPLVSVLEQNQCTVLADPSSLQDLTAFAPEVVVAFDGLVSEGVVAFEAIAAAAPQATLLFSFAHAASASGALQALVGAPQVRAQSEREVRAGLARAGYVVESRDIVVVPHAPSGLSADTEAALRQLFEQLNPDAAIDRLLVVAVRGAPVAEVERVPGLISVIVSSGTDLPPLEGTLAALAGQARGPLEVLVASALPHELFDRAVSRLRARASLDVHRVETAASDSAGRTNAGLARARGQYVAFLEAGELVGPLHLASLHATLEASTAAWAIASPPSLAPPFALVRWLEAGVVPRARWLIDRARLGPFALTFAEGTPLAEHLLFTRLALLFPPALASTGPSDSLPTSVHATDDLRAKLAGRPLQTLTSLEALFVHEPLAVQLEQRVTERLEAVRPGAGKAVAQALAWWRALPERK